MNAIVFYCADTKLTAFHQPIKIGHQVVGYIRAQRIRGAPVKDLADAVARATPQDGETLLNAVEDK